MKKTMLDYVTQTPDTLERALGRSQALTAPVAGLLRTGNFRILRIVASGSSHNAARAARPLLRELLGMEVLVTPPHTFACYEHELPPDELTLVVSQSGYRPWRSSGGRAERRWASPVIRPAICFKPLTCWWTMDAARNRWAMSPWAYLP